MKYYVIAGEASGDLHAANLISEIKKLDANATFRGWGGDRIQTLGVELVKHYKDIAFMGFTEVLMNLRTIMASLKFCKKDIQSYRPDALILVDYPGFNLRIAKFAHEAGLKVFYYISPQVWAWKKSRVKLIKKYVDKMLVILPFEKGFYKNEGVDVEFVGHPLLDAIGDELPDKKKFAAQFRSENNLPERPIIAILPGSRKQEVAQMLKTMLSVREDFMDYQFIIGAVSSIPKEFYANFTSGSNVNFVYDKTYDLLKSAKAALVTSGTATLETALFEVPEIVCYKGGAISYQIARRLVRVDFISLVNLIMGREIVRELIQNEFNYENLNRELNLIANDNTQRKRILSNYRLLKDKLGGRGASANAAKYIVEHS